MDAATAQGRETIVVLHRDEHLLVVDKPSGLLVHRGWGNDDVTAVDLARSLVGRAVFPVHRLDRGTSGVLAFALDSDGARRLHQAFEAGQVRKRYLAAVRGVPPEEGRIDHPIPRREGGPRVPAVSEFRRLSAGAHRALVEVRPLTGRLHQIRRHLKHLSHPVLGDANYGKGALNRELRAGFGLARLALHCAELALPHPATGTMLTLSCPIPADLAEPLARMSLFVP